MVSVIRIMLQLTVSPALIDQRPGHDARVVDVPLDRFRPFLIEAAGHLASKIIRARHLAPDEEA